MELGSAELRVAAPEAADHLAAAMKVLRQPELLTTVALQLANALTMRGDADHAVATMESAIVLVEPENPELALILEAELAAKGHSNPEIAQRLFVTRKTIETHLGHIYSKLDISGRAELGRALTRDNSTAAG